MSWSTRASSCWTASQVAPISAASGSVRRWKSRSAASRLRRRTGSEEQEARDRARVRRRGDRAAVGLEAADRLEQRERLAGGRRVVAGREGDAQHPQHEVGRLHVAAGVEERLRLVAEHRAVAEAPHERDALLHVLAGQVGPGRGQPGGGVVAAQRERGGVDRLPHVGADDVAHRARALAGTLDACAHRGRRLRVERQPLERLGAVHGARVASVAEHREELAPAEHDARRGLGRALELDLEDAVHHARGDLRAGEVAAEPVELVGDPGEHQASAAASGPAACCCCWACPDQPP